MNLVYFLFIGAIFTSILGELGHFPFGANSPSVSATDFLLTASLIFFLIWNLAIKKQFVIPNVFKIIVLFWLVGLISLIYSLNFSGSLYLIRFIVYSSAFLISFNLVKNKLFNLPKLFNYFIAIGVVYSLIGLIQFIIYPNMDFFTQFGYDPHIGRLFSSFLDPNFSGSFLSLIFILGIYQYLSTKHNKYLVVCFLFITAILLTFSRSAYLLLLVEIFTIGIIKFKKILIAALVGLVGLYLLIPKFAERINGGFLVDASATERFASWQAGWIIFQSNLILGVGFNNLRSAYEKYDLFKVFSANGGHAGAGVDSSLIFILATTGMIGGIIFLILFLKIFQDLIFNEKKSDLVLNLSFIAMLVGLLINSQFINSLFYPPVMLLIFSLLGARYATD